MAINGDNAAEADNDTPEETAQRLRDTAAQFRAQAAELENKREQERREYADRSFSAFDSNKDGAVGIAELRAGLEGPLRKTFTKQVAARMGRKPTAEEVDARIAELPGGSLFPDDLARRLIDMYDSNGDGLLQRSEFAPTEELRARLESMFQERREEELEERKVERQRLMDDKVRKKTGKAVVKQGDLNDDTATSVDKALSALPYILPLSDGMVYAQHLFQAFPAQTAWAEPVAGLLLAFQNIPFGTLVAFFGMSILASNPSVNKLLRFNMLQAINLDIALILPVLLEPLASTSLTHDAYKLAPISNAASDLLFVALLAAVVYSIGSSATGTLPTKLPLFGRLNRENPDRNK